MLTREKLHPLRRCPWPSAEWYSAFFPDAMRSEEEEFSAIFPSESRAVAGGGNFLKIYSPGWGVRGERTFIEKKNESKLNKSPDENGEMSCLPTNIVSSTMRSSYSVLARQSIYLLRILFSYEISFCRCRQRSMKDEKSYYWISDGISIPLLSAAGSSNIDSIICSQFQLRPKYVEAGIELINKLVGTIWTALRST